MGLHEDWTRCWHAALALIETAVATGAVSPSDAGVRRAALQAEREAVEAALRIVAAPAPAHLGA